MAQRLGDIPRLFRHARETRTDRGYLNHITTPLAHVTIMVGNSGAGSTSFQETDLPLN